MGERNTFTPRSMKFKNAFSEYHGLVAFRTEPEAEQYRETLAMREEQDNVATAVAS